MRYLLTLLLFLSVAFSQGVNDKNFKEKVNGGVVIAVFTSEWQEQDLEVKKKLGKSIWMGKWIVPLKKLKVLLTIC